MESRRGYLANVTTYTVARLVMEIDEDAVLLDIWRQQKLPPDLIDSIRRLSSAGQAHSPGRPGLRKRHGVEQEGRMLEPGPGHCVTPLRLK